MHRYKYKKKKLYINGEIYAVIYFHFYDYRLKYTANLVLTGKQEQSYNMVINISETIFDTLYILMLFTSYKSIFLSFNISDIKEI